MSKRPARKLDLTTYLKNTKAREIFYRKLIYDHWVCFDGILRPICGVEIDLDLSDVKPIRQSPYHLSPAKTLIAKELINGFIKEGIVKSATSEWAFPIVIVPKGGTLKPGEKRQWRLCVDVRKLNLVIPAISQTQPCDVTG